MCRKAIIDKCQKQSVNVQICKCLKKKRKGKRPQKKASGVSNIQSNTYAQPYHPVFIQSGFPSQPEAPQAPKMEETNVLLNAIHNNVKKHHEILRNSLLSKVTSAPIETQTEPTLHTENGSQTHSPIYSENGSQTHSPIYSENGTQTRLPINASHGTQTRSAIHIEHGTQTSSPIRHIGNPLLRRPIVSRAPVRVDADDSDNFSLSTSLLPLNQTTRTHTIQDEPSVSFFGRMNQSNSPTNSGLLSPIMSSSSPIHLGEGTENETTVHGLQTQEEERRPPFVVRHVNSRAVETPAPARKPSAWNQFNSENKGKGWTLAEMRARYNESKKK